MKISKNSWHYRIYSSEYSGDTNLCSYVQGIVSIAFRYVLGAILLACVAVAWAAAFPIATILMVLHGHLPIHWNLAHEPFARKYKPVQAFGHRLYPAHIVTPLVALWAISQFLVGIPIIAWQQELFPVLVLTGLLTGVCVFLTCISYTVVKNTLHDFPKDDDVKGVFTLVYEYARAKKNRVCPLVTFVDESN